MSTAPPNPPPGSNDPTGNPHPPKNPPPTPATAPKGDEGPAADTHLVNRGTLAGIIGGYTVPADWVILSMAREFGLVEIAKGVQAKRIAAGQ